MQRALLGVQTSQQGILQSFASSTRLFHNGVVNRSVSSFFVDHLRRRARSAAEEVTRQERRTARHHEEDLSFSEALNQGISKALSGWQRIETPKASFVDSSASGSAYYGKWQSLSLDHDRLFNECDIEGFDSDSVRLVDQPDNQSDIELWACLLNFCHRYTGHDGVLMIWKAVFERRKLHQTTGPLPRAFWGKILDTAVQSDVSLQEVVIYANWLRQTHDTTWPNLYSTVISYMLLNGVPLRRLMQWHLTLMPSFGPNENDFVDFLKKFIENPDKRVQRGLQLIYKGSAHRNLYDTLIPHLYGNGHSKLALQWRTVCIAANDVPVSLEARRFLRHLCAYYTPEDMTDRELQIAGVSPETTPEHGPEIPYSENGNHKQDLSYLLNRAHGEAFGIKEKAYNDRLGAKWLASSWVPLDFAINVIYTMGIQAIGPLSLQSIALREGNASGVLNRLDQLEQLNIDLPDMNYVKAIRHHALTGDDKALRELIDSDVHPDVFDDDMSQQRVLEECVLTNRWDIFSLLQRTNMAVRSAAVATSSDIDLRRHLRQGNLDAALRTLRDMIACEVDLAPSTSHGISGFVLNELSPHVEDKIPHKKVDMLVSLCRLLAKTRFPPAVETWHRILCRLAREKRLDEVERIALEILRIYHDNIRSDKPMWAVHTADVPDILRTETPYSHFQELPRDLPFSHAKHPLSQIFDPQMQGSIIRWGFMYTEYNREAEARAAEIIEVQGSITERDPTDTVLDNREPVEFHFARGIRLLAMLRDRGVSVRMSSVRLATRNRLVEKYKGGGDPDYSAQRNKIRGIQMRIKNRLDLAEAKMLCNAAWASSTVSPSLEKLKKRIQAVELKDRSALMRWEMELFQNRRSGSHHVRTSR